MDLGARHLLAWDIETTGFDKTKELVTVVSFFDPDGVQDVIRFVELNDQKKLVYKADHKKNVAKLVKYLEEADFLCAFNGTNFDLPFIQMQFGIPNEIVRGWVLKSWDVLETCRRGFKRTFSLNMLLEMNCVGEGGKTGDGLLAVKQAQQGKWDELEKYCMSDSMLTYEVSVLKTINCPEGFQWRKEHGGETHDPTNVFKINTTAFPKIKFSYGLVEL